MPTVKSLAYKNHISLNPTACWGKCIPFAQLFVHTCRHTAVDCRRSSKLIKSAHRWCLTSHSLPSVLRTWSTGGIILHSLAMASSAVPAAAVACGWFIAVWFRVITLTVQQQTQQTIPFQRSMPPGLNNHTVHHGPDPPHLASPPLTLPVLRLVSPAPYGIAPFFSGFVTRS